MKLMIHSLICAGILLGPALQLNAENKRSVKKAQPIHDVTLNAQGALKGLVVDIQGKALAGAEVTVIKNNKQIGSLITDKDGKFQSNNLSTGIYELRTAQGKGIVRVWAEKVAPPSAKSQVLLVNGNMTARAQAGLLEQPRVIDYAILGTAITGAALGGAALAKDKETTIVSP